MFNLSNTPLDPAILRKDLQSDQAGAFASFEGLVRDHNDGQDVVALEYEAHMQLCISEAMKIVDEAKENFDIIDLRCSHRIGKLEIGDMAVWVGVIAAHRDDAFQACRYIIDELKKRLPIWKKEYYKEGHSDWLGTNSSTKNEYAR